jgi:hypothetical protein
MLFDQAVTVPGPVTRDPDVHAQPSGPSELVDVCGGGPASIWCSAPNVCRWITPPGSSEGVAALLQHR